MELEEMLIGGLLSQARDVRGLRAAEALCRILSDRTVFPLHRPRVRFKTQSPFPRLWSRPGDNEPREPERGIHQTQMTWRASDKYIQEEGGEKKWGKQKVGGAKPRPGFLWRGVLSCSQQSGDGGHEDLSGSDSAAWLRVQLIGWVPGVAG